MSIRGRLILLILLVGTLPVVGAMVWMTIQMESLVVSSGQAAMARIGESFETEEAITAEIQQMVDVVAQRSAVCAAIVGLVSLGVAVFVGVSLTAPLRGMTDAVVRVTAGEWDAIPFSQRTDELGALSSALRDMVLRLRGQAESLEEQAADRVDGLQAVADVSSATTSVLDPDVLIHQTVELVRERFDLYYVGLFLIDGGAQQAVLRAGTGDAGRQMLAQGHRLQVGGGSMIGQCVVKDEIRIAMDAGHEEFRFENPLLPRTRSELALPMRSRGRVIGAMTVQSENEAAFDTTYISVLQTMADQVAVAIDNAQLYADAQAAVAELETMQRHLTSRAWTEYAQTGRPLVYETQNAGGASPVDPVLPEIQQALAHHGATVLTDPGHHTALVTPITLRGEVIGALGVHDQDANRHWTDDDHALVQAVVERMGVIADGLRLLDEARHSAARERTVTRVTARLRETLDVDTVLQTAAYEMRDMLNLAEAEVRIGTGPTSDPVGGEVRTRELQVRSDVGYVCGAQGVQVAEGQWRPEMVQAVELGQIIHDDGLVLFIPITIRDQIAGATRLRKSDGFPAWTGEEIAMMETLTERLGVALESAWLYQDTQRRQLRERVISVATSRMREPIELDAVLRTAASEIRDALDLDELVVRLGSARQ